MRGTDCDVWVAIEPIARQTGERVAIVDRIPFIGDFWSDTFLSASKVRANNLYIRSTNFF